MTKAERDALRALELILGDDDDTWRAAGRMVVMSDGDIVATCYSAMGAMPDPFDADDAARFIAAARNSIRALLNQLDEADGIIDLLRESMDQVAGSKLEEQLLDVANHAAFNYCKKHGAK